MGLLCKLFGHRPMPGGWWGDIPYMELHYKCTDNIGRIHGAAYHECYRCGVLYIAGRLHFNDPTIVKSLAGRRALTEPDIAALEEQEK